jgi:response regulator RpfG family c-di-GMP phosphodiesterase
MTKPFLLCVDDERILLESLRVELRREVGTEFLIETASSGAEALEVVRGLVLEGSELVMVISDENMPGMRGHELLTAIRELSPETHLVLLTGYSDLEAIQKAVNVAGLYRYMNKPWRIDELVFTIRQAYRSRRQGQTIREQKGRIARLTKSMIFALETANQNSDEDTMSHIERVSAYSAALAEALGKDQNWVERIHLYAGLHDIGKVGVACQLLNSPDKFTEAEREVQKQHVRYGFQILSTEGIDEMASNIALYHHERWDGKGYIMGVKGDAIPLEARIVALIDVFDALSTRRSYKDALPFDDAWTQILDMSGSWFDPQIVAAFRGLKDVMRGLKDSIE